MHKITFECETITPMFLSGADGTTPELRPPSIKGMLRFWWRAMNGHLPLVELKRIEGEIFGDTGRRSNLIIRVLSKQPGTADWISTSPLPHRNGGRGGHVKEGIKVGFTFKVQFMLLNSQAFSEEKLEALFYVTATLGSLGNRSRRGFGAFKVQNEEFSLSKLHRSIERISSHSSQRYKVESEKITVINSRFSPSYPCIKSVELGRATPNPTLKIGNATHDVKGRLGVSNYGRANGSPKPRLASPVYVSTLSTAKGLRPIITTLSLPNGKGYHLANQRALIDEIL